MNWSETLYDGECKTWGWNGQSGYFQSTCFWSCGKNMGLKKHGY